MSSDGGLRAAARVTNGRILVDQVIEFPNWLERAAQLQVALQPSTDEMIAVPGGGKIDLVEQ